MKHIIIYLCIPFFAMAQHGGELINCVAGEAIADNSFIYLDSLVYNASATDIAEQATGYVLAGGSAGDTIQAFFSDGLHFWQAKGLKPGEMYYLSSATALTNTKPTRIIQEIGIALSDSILFLRIRPAQRNIIAATLTLNFGSTDSGRSSDLTASVSGVSAGDPILVSGPNIEGAVFTALSETDGQVTVRYFNSKSISQNPAEDTYTIRVIK